MMTLSLNVTIIFKFSLSSETLNQRFVTLRPLLAIRENADLAVSPEGKIMMDN